jgi:hypothetical protein
MTWMLITHEYRGQLVSESCLDRINPFIKKKKWIIFCCQNDLLNYLWFAFCIYGNFVDSHHKTIFRTNLLFDLNEISIETLELLEALIRPKNLWIPLFCQWSWDLVWIRRSCAVLWIIFQTKYHEFAIRKSRLEI